MKKLFLLLLSLAVFAVFSFAQAAKPDALKEYLANNYREAIRICEEELKTSPHNRESYVVLCWALVANRQYREAEQVASEARTYYPSEVRLIEVLGEAKYFLDKKTEALELFQRYIADTNENASRIGRVYYYMGEIYILESKFNHADIALSMAVRIEPLMDSWWSRLGYAREQVASREQLKEQQIEDYKTALSAYNQALKLNPSQYNAQEGKKRCQSNL